MLDSLEAEFTERGARRVASVAPGLERRGYQADPALVYVERELPPVAKAPHAIARLGGRIIGPGLWEELRGLEEAKELIERRVILPLAEPGLAARHAVAPPKAIVLFGPPGTGKTTFAKGIASRLGWPFVELEPSRLGEGEAETLVRCLRRAPRTPVRRGVHRRGRGHRVDAPGGPPREREPHQRAAAPDPAHPGRARAPPGLRHQLGRPARPRLSAAGQVRLRPCGRPARRRGAHGDLEALRRRDLRRDVDIPALVEATDLYTPADIEFAARKAAQRAFEREHFERSGPRATTDDFLIAIRQTRPTLARDIIDAFEEDRKNFARY